MPTLTLTRRSGLRYLGGKRFGAWLSQGICPDHRVLCSGLTWGGNFLEVTIRGRSAGACW